ncbi:unnamed protein product [Didymodactylos carnosus]|uniref:F-box domain-containing protein n=1 Tax=Didymodactylos carnosus TaxID=1234261 RepID=A0A814PMJ1_9BILA|nr:unnamed protein product [Didymodactylos carnosus]CAF1108174.1 unnamed protein product [Didymodactylos carnosus]CAF3786623.1 unnamed protein product [Didymodactylos carnosus]CAF3872718.1 unnamed protein product [Didymodactylos carnosus]
MSVTRFECLPNELVFEIFEYFDKCALYYSFYSLNTRLSYLLTAKQWYLLNFINSNKLTFARVCQNIIPQYIRSLSLYNRHSPITECSIIINQIPMFFSLFSVVELVNLCTLKLFDIKEHELKLISFDLYNLSYLLIELDSRRTTQQCFSETFLFLLLSNAIPTLRRLSFSANGTVIDFKQQVATTTSNIEYLSMNNICIDHMEQLLKYVPRLKYFSYSIDTSYPEFYTITVNNLQSIVSNLVCLKLKFNFKLDFGYIETVLGEFPKLKYLTLEVTTCMEDKKLVDGNHWKQLIQRYLPLLTKFSFLFKIGTAIPVDIDTFRTSFWFDEHRWFVQYDHHINNMYSYVYTHPYINRQFDIEAISTCTTVRTAPLFLQRTMYNNVRQLSLTFTIFGETILSDRYYSNISTLKISNEHKIYISFYKLRTLINLSTIKLLIFDNNKTQIIYRLFKYLPNLNSLYLYDSHLIQITNIFDSYLNEKIQKIFINLSTSISNRQLENLFRTFSNLDELHIRIDNIDDILLIINKMRKLSFLFVQCSDEQRLRQLDDIRQWLMENTLLNNNFNLIQQASNELHIWIDRYCL